MAVGDTTTVDDTGIGTDPLTGEQTGTESSLSTWVGPYVTDMLGRGEALASEPYQAYTGPLTAGESELQQTAFSGIAGLTIPTEQMGAFTPGTFSAETAQQYMNPYLQAALQPQIDEARRQAQISRLGDAARLTKAGAFGGSRQAIMESELNRNMLQNLAGITGEGYRTAYDKAVQQFEREQGREMDAQRLANEYGLAAIRGQAELGRAQRDIEQEGITADRLQFEEERDFPYKQVQYMQSLLQGLPIAAQSYSYQQPSALSEFAGSASGLMELYNMLFPDGISMGTTPENEFTGTTPESDETGLE